MYLVDRASETQMPILLLNIPVMRQTESLWRYQQKIAFNRRSITSSKWTECIFTYIHIVLHAHKYSARFVCMKKTTQVRFDSSERRHTAHTYT